MKEEQKSQHELENEAKKAKEILRACKIKTVTDK